MAQHIVGLLLARVLTIPDEVLVHSDVKDILHSMASKLEVIQASISDATRMNPDSQATSLWMKKLEVVASDGLNLLDDYQYILLKGKQRKSFTFVKNISILGLSFRAQRVKSIIDDAYSELLQMDLPPVADPERSQIEQTDFSVIESEIVGRGRDVNHLVGILLSSVRERPVMSIVGMAGVGKTTVAQMVYNHREIEYHFPHRIWVPVATDYNVDRILKEMLEQLTLKSVGVSSRAAVLAMLKRFVHHTRYLLVLDDVWNENQELWYSMRTCLQTIGGSGSTVLITTRNLRVASSMKSDINYCLHVLPFSESRSLFEQVAYGGDWCNRTPAELDSMNGTVQRCGGLPLAIKAIGGLVMNKNKAKWENASSLWSLFDFPNQVFSSLRPSYDSLPSLSAKQCFVYCSIFPRHSVLERKQLVQLWMAQGFISDQPHNQFQDMEDLGDDYFDLLLQRSMLEEVENEFRCVKSCKMHEVVLEFASSLFENFCLITEVNQTDADILSSCVHLHLICRDMGTPSSLMQSYPMLRTLILDHGFLPAQLTGIQYVRVLILNNPEVLRLPRSIGLLKHLRCLDISKTRIERLPISITKLCYLQTLRLYTLVEVPSLFHRLTNLRHLCIGNDFYNKRYRMIPQIGELTNLRTIPPFLVSQESGCTILELGPLHHLRGELKIFGLENVKDGNEAIQANLTSKSKIQSLELHWNSASNRRGSSEADEILQCLRPNSNLKCLAIFHFPGSQFPSWIGHSSESSVFISLVAIKLQNCNMCTQIPALGHLPSLRVVQINTLKQVKQITNHFYGFQDLSAVTSNIFPVLTDLTVTSMSNLEMWYEQPPSATVFQSLEKWTLSGCPKLISLPDGIPFAMLRKLSIMNCGKLYRLPRGISSMVSLESLEILHCNSLEEIPNISKCSALRELFIVDCMRLRSLPTDLRNCENLREVYILSCPLMCIESDLQHCRSLQKLEIGYFSDELDYFSWPCSISSITSFAGDIQPLPLHFASLTSLKLCGWPKLSSLPDQVQHIPLLNHLQVSLFQGLEDLPDWLGMMSSLETLYLEDCWNLALLPSVKMTGLVKLTILRCPLLEHRCTVMTGSEWPKIKHIPNVYLGLQE